MADPRWHSNYTRSRWHEQATELDSPALHGWQPIDVNDEGYTIFGLGDALMRRVMPRDRLIDAEWLVFIDGKVYGSYSGSLAVITADVRKVLSDRIPFSGEATIQDNCTDNYGLLPPF